MVHFSFFLHYLGRYKDIMIEEGQIPICLFFHNSLSLLSTLVVAAMDFGALFSDVSFPIFDAASDFQKLFQNDNILEFD